MQSRQSVYTQTKKQTSNSISEAIKLAENHELQTFRDIAINVSMSVS